MMVLHLQTGRQAGLPQADGGPHEPSCLYRARCARSISTAAFNPFTGEIAAARFGYNAAGVAQ